MKNLSDYSPTNKETYYNFSFKLAEDKEYTLIFRLTKHSHNRTTRNYTAGCRTFTSKKAAIAHWTRRKAIAEKMVVKGKAKKKAFMAKVDKAAADKIVKGYGKFNSSHGVDWNGEVRGHWLGHMQNGKRKGLCKKLEALNKESRLYLRNGCEYPANYHELKDWQIILNRANIYLKALKEFPEGKIERKYRL